MEGINADMLTRKYEEIARATGRNDQGGRREVKRGNMCNRTRTCVFGFYSYAVLPVFRLGFSVSVLKSIGFAVFNIATVNGFWRYLGKFSDNKG